MSSIRSSSRKMDRESPRKQPRPPKIALPTRTVDLLQQHHLHLAARRLGGEQAGGDHTRVVRDQIGRGADWVKLYGDYRWGPLPGAHPTFSQDEMTLAVTAIPSTPPKADGNGFTIERKFYLPDGTPADLTNVHQNDRFVVVLSVKATELGSGTAPVIGTTSWGEVPQVTCGSMLAASSSISVS